MLIEQAIFTSARTDRAAGYQLIARSPGVTEPDARELVVRGPSHDALAASGADAASFNFHRLPSGALAFSQTVLAGDEYSNRGAERVYTQFLLVPSALLARFSNNPFAVWRAALAQGSARVYDDPPEQLEPITLAGRAAPVDVSLLREVATASVSGLLAVAILPLLRRQSVAIVTKENRDRLTEALLNCLPVDLRTAFSFSTGLRLSPRRPVQLAVLPRDFSDRRKVERDDSVLVVTDDYLQPAMPGGQGGWAGYVHAMLSAGNLAGFKNKLTEVPAGLSFEQLNELGHKWLQELNPAVFKAPAAPDPPARPLADDLPPARNPYATNFPAEAAREAQPEEGWRRPDSGHPQFKRPGAPAALAICPDLSDDPSVILGQHCPEALQRLELLDDTVFEAIAGKAASLQKLKELWPEVLSQLGPDLVEESRAQYLRHVLSVWRQYLDEDPVRDPRRAVSALDVMSILLGDES